MKRFLNLSVADLRNILRDEMLSPFFVFAPVAVFMGARLLIPWVCKDFPVMLPYADLMVMFIGMQAATIYGFIMGSVTLDEKDEQVITALRVLPVAPDWFVINRLGIATLFSFLFMCLYFRFNGTVQLAFPQFLWVAFFFSLLAPLVMLPSAAFARNKVEGFASFKIVNALLIVPVLSFFVPDAWQCLFWVFPNYWTFHLYRQAVAGDPEVFYLLGALLSHAFVIYILVKLFVKKVF